MIAAIAGNTTLHLSHLITNIYIETEKNADKEAKRLIDLWRDDTESNWPVAEVDSKDSKGTIQQPTRESVASYRFEITAPYAHVIEYGRYPGVGPKTARRIAQPIPGTDLVIQAGIYPTQKPTAPNLRGAAKAKREMVSKSIENIRPKGK